MELITKEKARITTFKKRKQGLIRKMHEFKTLCDLSACMIIYGPKEETGFTEPEIWPQDPVEVRRIIDIYKAKNRDSGNKTYGLSDFFHDRNRKKEEELVKLRKKNMEAKYPTWLEFMDFMAEASLRDFAARLRSKADYVRSRMELLRRNKQGLMDYYYYHHHQNPHARLDVELEDLKQIHVPNSNIHYPSTSIDNSMLLMNTNYNDHDNYQRGGESMVAGWGVVDPAVICPRLLGPYYGPMGPIPMRVPPSPYGQLQYSTWENNHNDGGDQEGVNGGPQYQLMNYNNMIGKYYE